MEQRKKCFVCLFNIGDMSLGFEGEEEFHGNVGRETQEFPARTRPKNI